MIAFRVLSTFIILLFAVNAQGETVSFGGLGTYRSSRLQQAGLTLTPEVDLPLLYLLSGNGVGVVGGSSDTSLDPGESLLFSFSSLATEVSYSVQFGADADSDGSFAEAWVEGYGAGGTLLGVVSVAGTGAKDVSSLFGDAPLSAFRVHTRDGDRQRISAVGFNLGRAGIFYVIPNKRGGGAVIYLE